MSGSLNNLTMNDFNIHSIIDDNDNEDDNEQVDDQMEGLNNQINDFINEYDQYSDIDNHKVPEHPKPMEEGKKYIFESLDTDLDGYLNQPLLIPNIHICSYYVNTKGHIPFLQYFLYKEKTENKENEFFTFPTFKYDPKINIMFKVLAVMESLCISYYKDRQYTYKGFKIYNNDIYIFFDCTQLDIESVRLDRNNDLWLVLIDEIINKGVVCNYKIADTVIDFFYNNSKLIFLRDLEHNIYETPTVVYASCPEKRLHFCSVFGISSFVDESSLFGNYFYFTDFQNTFNHVEDGIIRLAIFLGKMKIVRNLENEPVDESEITRHLFDKYSASESDKEKLEKLKLTMRVSDRGGLWATEYNSIFMGKIELDDGSFIDNYPMWVVKEYKQQIVISSHLRDKKKRENILENTLESEEKICCIR